MQSTQSTQSTDVSFDVVWKPYQLDASTAEFGEDFDAYCKRRWGGSEWTNHLRQQGQPDGALFGKWIYWSNTLRAHQWIQYGVEHHQASTDACNATLFRALYEEGLNISDVETLVRLGKVQFGESCDETSLCDYLTHNRGKEHVLAEMETYKKRYKISSVPRFVITKVNDGNDDTKSFELSGAQPARAFTEVFEELLGSE
jgi:predicted DsbA family dithiol-disulfide isomerase